MLHDEHDREQQAKHSHNDIAPSKEVIFPSKPIRRRDHYGFLDLLFDVEIYCHIGFESQLAKIRTFRSVFAGMSCSIRP